MMLQINWKMRSSNGLVLEGSGGVQMNELVRWANSGMDVISSGLNNEVPTDRYDASGN